ncbi:hypothetical protein [Propioniciclava sp.]|uniref:hypothetical protein n=1 Tax=Propioniciclava sp. TaxID=2038686 RepID=UPI0026061013|nr:hypothetical protein [Propioniciclava sp.]
MANPNEPTWERETHTPEFIDETGNRASDPLAPRPTTDSPVPGSPVGEPPSAGDRAKGVADHAAGEAKDVKDHAVTAASGVVDTAKQEAGHVMDEAKLQGRRLLDEGANELRTQAGAAQGQLASFVRQLSDELQTMTRSEASGPMTDLAGRAEQYGHQLATFLEQKSPDDVLVRLRRYAARNPWTFLAISAGAGFLAARLFRGLQGAHADDQRYEGYETHRTLGQGSPFTAQPAAEFDPAVSREPLVPRDAVVDEVQVRSEWGESR